MIVVGIVALGLATHVPQLSAQRRVSVGDRVRVFTPEGDRVARGRVQTITSDSVVVGGDPAASVLIESLQSGGYRLDAQTGTHALEGALYAGSLLGVLTGTVAYCLQVLRSGCARDAGAAAKGGLAGFAVGATIGGLIGAVSPEYETLDVRAFGLVDAAFVPHAVGSGGLGVGGVIRLSQ